MISGGQRIPLNFPSGCLMRYSVWCLKKCREDSQLVLVAMHSIFQVIERSQQLFVFVFFAFLQFMQFSRSLRPLAFVSASVPTPILR